MHISFNYRPNRIPMVAKGVIAVGQFALAYSCIAQFAVHVDQGVGPVLHRWADLLGRFWRMSLRGSCGGEP